MLGGAAAAVAAFGHSALSFMAAAGPGLLERPHAARTAVAEPRTRTATATAEDEEVEDTKDQQSKKNSTDFNITLQLSDGFPGDGAPGVDQGPPWAKCHVTYSDRSERDEHGSVVPRMVLEEWVMKGSSEHINAFKSWRQQTLDAPAEFRCLSTSQKAIEEVKCLSCVPRSGGLPLSPAGHLSSVHPGPFSNSFVLTIGGVDQCLAGSFGSSSFCKSGSVAVAM